MEEVDEVELVVQRVTALDLVLALTLAGSHDEAIGGRAGSDRHRRSYPQPVGALVGAFQLRVRIQCHRFRPRNGRHAPGAW
jgi:hypothetical protein